MEQQSILNYSQAIGAIKTAILQSRYRAAVLVNGEMLSLYFGIGKYISENSREGFWGTNAIEVISQQLQHELPGLRGVGARNLKNMRLFYESWSFVFNPQDENRQTLSADLEIFENQQYAIRPLPTDEICTDILLVNCQPVAGDFKESKWNCTFFIPLGMNRSVENAIMRPNPVSHRDATCIDGVAFLRNAGIEVWLAFLPSDPSLTGWDVAMWTFLYRRLKPTVNKVLSLRDREHRDMSKPMGVASYKFASELPEQYRDILPDTETLRQLL